MPLARCLLLYLRTYLFSITSLEATNRVPEHFVSIGVWNDRCIPGAVEGSITRHASRFMNEYRAFPLLDELTRA